MSLITEGNKGETSAASMYPRSLSQESICSHFSSDSSDSSDSTDRRTPPSTDVTASLRPFTPPSVTASLWPFTPPSTDDTASMSPFTPPRTDVTASMLPFTPPRTDVASSLWPFTPPSTDDTASMSPFTPPRTDVTASMLPFAPPTTDLTSGLLLLPITPRRTPQRGMSRRREVIPSSPLQTSRPNPTHDPTVSPHTASPSYPRDSALHMAASRGHIEAVKVLVGVIDVNARGKLSRTPLHRAVLEGHVDVARLLMDCRAKINVKDDRGHTPMALAAKYKHRILLRALLRRNAKIDEKAMALAASSGCWDLVEIFLHRTRKLANACYKRNPILVLAVKDRRVEIIELLLRKGASPTKCRKPGKSALDYAMKYGEGEIVDLLLRKDTKYNKPKPLHAFGKGEASAEKTNRN